MLTMVWLKIADIWKGFTSFIKADDGKADRKYHPVKIACT
jgi:hypothetical protein